MLLQVIIAVLAILAAGIKAVQFMPNELTDFELRRRLQAGDDQAARESILRKAGPLLDALRRLGVLLLSVVIVVALASRYNTLVAIALALLWLLLIELLSAQPWFRVLAERLAKRYQPQFIRTAQRLSPLLRLLANKQLRGNAPDTAFYSKQELLDALERDRSVLDKDEKLLLRQALSYQDKQVRDIMTPRSVVVTAKATDTVGPVLLDRLHKAGHSRYPVTDGDLDNVQGVLYMHNLVPLDPQAKTVGDVMDQAVFYVQQEQPLDHVLRAFLRTKHHLFMVVNEFEEIVGVISIEDVLEAIIGRKIVDEFDQYDDLRAVARLAAAKRRKVRED